jgi:hypothetical protein
MKRGTTQSEAQATGRSLDPVVRCSRIVGDPIGRGIANWHYAISVSQLWDQKLGTMDRTGLCSECDAAIYRAGVSLYHADAGGFYRITPNPESTGQEPHNAH